MAALECLQHTSQEQALTQRCGWIASECALSQNCPGWPVLLTVLQTPGAAPGASGCCLTLEPQERAFWLIWGQVRQNCVMRSGVWHSWVVKTLDTSPPKECAQLGLSLTWYATLNPMRALLEGSLPGKVFCPVR